MTANYEQPGVMNKRVRFYDGQFLQDQDFVDEQKYHLDRRQRLTRWLHVSGIANGLDVRTTNQPFQVKVTSGTAIDPDGRLLVLATMKTILDSDSKALLADAADPVILPPNAANSDRWLYIAYHQLPDDLQASGDGVEGETRWHEAPFLFTAPAILGEDDTYDGPSWLDFLTDGPPPPVLLARLTLDANGAITIDNNVRRYSGLRLPGLRTDNQAATLRAENDGRIGLWSLKDGDLKEHLSVTEKGYLGMGTSAPNAALEIRTELKATVQNRALVGLHIAPTYNANNLSGVRQYGLLVEAGSVGIGTTAPAAALEVVGSGGNSVDLLVNGRLRSNNNDGGLWVASDRFIGGHSTNKVGFYNGAWRLTVQNDGKVGIGTPSPAAALEVAGGGGSTIDLLVNGRLRSNNNDGGLWVASDRFVGGHSTNKVGFFSNSAWRLTVQSDGKVGIGTQTPAAALEVAGDGGSTIDLLVNGRLRSNNDDGGLWVASDRFIGGHSTNKVGFYNNKAWRLTVQSDGKVGIGTQTPDMLLDVAGSIRSVNGVVRAGNDTDNYAEIGHGGSHGYLNVVGVGRLDFRHEGSTLVSIKDDGTVGIGTDDPKAKLEVSGDLLLSGNSNITTRRGLLRIGTTDGSKAKSDEVVGGVGFYGFGVQHGQLSFRAGKGFEMIDCSSSGPTLNYTRDDFPYADLRVRNLQIGDWTLTGDGDHLYIKRGSSTVARFSITHDRFQVYKNLDNKAPYFYYNKNGDYGKYNG